MKNTTAQYVEAEKCTNYKRTIEYLEQSYQKRVDFTQKRQLERWKLHYERMADIYPPELITSNYFRYRKKLFARRTLTLDSQALARAPQNMPLRAVGFVTAKVNMEGYTVLTIRDLTGSIKVQVPDSGADPKVGQICVLKLIIHHIDINQINVLKPNSKDYQYEIKDTGISLNVNEEECTDNLMQFILNCIENQALTTVDKINQIQNFARLSGGKVIRMSECWIEIEQLETRLRLNWTEEQNIEVINSY